MRRRDTYWSLFHTPEKRQINDLRTDHLEAIFEAISVKDHKDWFIWREGFSTWKPFTDFPQLIANLRQTSSQAITEKIPAPPGKRDGESGVSPSRTSTGRIEGPIETVAFEFAEDTDDLSERETRFPKRWDLRLIAGDRAVAAQTVNVSLNGMQLKEPLPVDFPKYFNAEFKAAGHTFSLVCSAIKDPTGKPSTRLKIEVNDQLHAYSAAVLQN